MARHKKTGSRAAIKVLHDDRSVSARLVERFTREIETLSLLRHPNIIEVYDIGQLQDGRPYYVIELITGMSLTELLNIHGRLQPLEMLELFDSICYALQAAHDANIVHGNVKSNNIMIVEEGHRRMVKVLDFALTRLARIETDSDSVELGFPGSPEAAAPEQIQNQEVTARTDVYALGVLLFQMLTGEYPFGGSDDLTIMEAHLRSSPPLPSQLAPLSQAIDSIVLRCLEKEPHRRFESVLSLQNAMHRALADEKRTAIETPQAVVVFIQVRAKLSDREDTVHNTVLREVMMFLDTTEDSLREAGFTIASNVVNGILGITPLPADRSGAKKVRTHALHIACQVYRELEERTIAENQSIEACVVIRIDARLSGSMTGEVQAPPAVLDEIKSWEVEGTGVYATADLLPDLASDDSTSKTPQGYVAVDYGRWA
ncbi:MAG: serine/threonine protein kinase [Proteobacteria bacterium]|nr:serine/threonine protein kinase [Pseudomonadota bacterium]